MTNTTNTTPTSFFAFPATEELYAEHKAAAAAIAGTTSVLEARDPGTGQIIGLYVVTGCTPEGRLLRRTIFTYPVR